MKLSWDGITLSWGELWQRCFMTVWAWWQKQFPTPDAKTAPPEQPTIIPAKPEFTSEKDRDKARELN